MIKSNGGHKSMLAPFELVYFQGFMGRGSGMQLIPFSLVPNPSILHNLRGNDPQQVECVSDRLAGSGHQPQAGSAHLRISLKHWTGTVEIVKRASSYARFVIDRV
jgi:hypothetical protein